MLHPSIINGKLVKSKACSSSICQNVTQKVYFLSSPLFEIIIHSPSYKNDFTGYFVFHKTGCQCLLSCRTERKFEVRPWFYLQKISSFCLNFFFYLWKFIIWNFSFPSNPQTSICPHRIMMAELLLFSSSSHCFSYVCFMCSALFLWESCLVPFPQATKEISLVEYRLQICPPWSVHTQLIHRDSRRNLSMCTMYEVLLS